MQDTKRRIPDTKKRIPDTESRIQTYAELCVGQMRCCATVSYTHLDVYKRQVWKSRSLLRSIRRTVHG